ncbi:MAG: hypothetical protein ACE5O2_13580, partial [Armatimonadota bacterium]
TGHLLNPGPERSIAEFQSKLLPPQDAEPVAYHQFLRTLDVLARNQARIRRGLLSRLSAPLDEGTALLFYDLGRPYPEARMQHLAARGRRGRPPGSVDPRLLVGVGVTRAGFPFAGSVRAERRVGPRTVRRTLAALGQGRPSARSIVVSDDTLIGEAEVELLERTGHAYMLHMTRAHPSLARSLFEQAEREPRQTLPDGAKMSVHEVGGARFVVLDSPQRAAATAEAIEARMADAGAGLRQLARDVAAGRVKREHTIVARAKRALAQAQAASLFRFEAAEGHFAFEPREPDAQAFGDGGSIWRHAGKYLLRTNILQPGAPDSWWTGCPVFALDRAFRELNTRVGLRPVWHRTAERIRGHITLSLMAYFLYQHLQQRLLENGHAMSAAQAIAVCDRVRTAPVTLGRETVWPTPRMSRDAVAVLRAVGLDDPAGRLAALLWALKGSTVRDQALDFCSGNYHVAAFVVSLCTATWALLLISVKRGLKSTAGRPIASVGEGASGHICSADERDSHARRDRRADRGVREFGDNRAQQGGRQARGAALLIRRGDSPAGGSIGATETVARASGDVCGRRSGRVPGAKGAAGAAER